MFPSVRTLSLTPWVPPPNPRGPLSFPLSPTTQWRAGQTALHTLRGCLPARQPAFLTHTRTRRREGGGWGVVNRTFADTRRIKQKKCQIQHCAVPVLTSNAWKVICSKERGLFKDDSSPPPFLSVPLACTFRSKIIQARNGLKMIPIWQG